MPHKIIFHKIFLATVTANKFKYCPSVSEQADNKVCKGICTRNGEYTKMQVIFIQYTDWVNLHALLGKRSISKASNKGFMRHQQARHVDDTKTFYPDEDLTVVYRDKRQCNSRERYVLFVVDTSGSISREQFEAVKDLLASISAELCDYLKVAMITYNHEINLEFCFNCYSDRSAIEKAIRRVTYRGGSTHTTDAIKCICREVLASRCGLPAGKYTPNIDVILLTDGQHNGPCQSDLKTELGCLHNWNNINTYGIGIGNFILQAILDLTKNDPLSIFSVKTFSELQDLFGFVQKLLSTKGTDGKPKYSCAGHAPHCHG